jgi:uncharacterized membrane protein YkoI
MPRSLSAVRSVLVLMTIIASAETPRATTTDIGPVASAKISLVAAVGIAEKHVEGKAVRAEYEKRKDGSWIYDVEVKTENALADVKIDPESGTVVASAADQAVDRAMAD